MKVGDLIRGKDYSHGMIGIITEVARTDHVRVYWLKDQRKSRWIKICGLEVIA
mgnify:FL=1